MQTLITGLPGNGKTLYALQFVSEWAKRENRPVWYHGIKGLSPDLGWHVLPTAVESVNGSDIEVPQWWLCPAKSIILIDEAQNCGFGVRPRSSVPDWARKLETHRHLGVDIVFITQDPALIDSHDRKLCELHFHVMRTFGLQRATVHEYRPVRDNLKSRKGSIEHKWKFPKHVFKWYTSAEAHTHKARIPAKVWLLGGIVVGLPILAWFAWTRFLDPHRVSAQAVASLGGPGTYSAASSAGPSKLTPAQWVEAQQPRVAGLAYSAPVFDDVTKPVEAPYPAACVQSATVCRCYSQQATRLEVPKTLCESIVAGGFYVAWQKKEAANASPGLVGTLARESGPVLVVGGVSAMQAPSGPSAAASVPLAAVVGRARS